MFNTEFSQIKKTWIDLRQQVNYWKAQHAKAVEREVRLKAYAQGLEEITAQQSIKIRDLTKQVADLTAEAILLRQHVFGQKTEQTKVPLSNQNNSDDEESESSSCKSFCEKRPRGQQKGTKGHGRKHYTHLSSVEIVYDLKEHQKRCSICNAPFLLFPTTEDSQDIHYEVRLVRRVHKRKCYLPTCNCGVVPGIVMAPPPAKLIPKGMFSVDFWVHLLSEKFLFQRPMSRILHTLDMEGLNISQGTITGGLQKIKEMVYPLYTRILEKNRRANHWHMDETRWMSFTVVDGKTGYRWWLWVVVTKDTVAYILDPSRSSAIPKNHLGKNPKGIISADRYSSYKALLSENLLIAYCWTHVRRDYTRIYDTRKKLQSWAQAWIDRINNIYGLNNRRLEVLSDKNKFLIADKTLRDALDSMKQTYENELECDALHPVKHKALNSLKEHWSGLLIFVDHPEIPMDNNLSERMLREAVVGRKNYYGCASLWSGDLTASLFTIFQTARLNHIHPKKYLKAYLSACAQNGGKPHLENIDDFLPWNLSQELKSEWKYPGRSSP